jgi:hypothetical protein
VPGLVRDCGIARPRVVAATNIVTGAASTSAATIKDGVGAHDSREDSIRQGIS